MSITALIVIAVLLVHVEPQDAVPEQFAFELSCTIFTRETTEADLVERFGREHVSSEPVFAYDDPPQLGTVLFSQQPDSRLEILWHDAENKRRPWLVMVRRLASRWRTPNGIALGDELRDLERANGRPFRLRGLRGEGSTGGSVISWDGGRLEVSSSDQCQTRIILQPAYDGTEATSLMRQVSSGEEYYSGHPAFQALNPRVVDISLFFRR
jgi:hypothetical protein